MIYALAAFGFFALLVCGLYVAVAIIPRKAKSLAQTILAGLRDEYNWLKNVVFFREPKTTRFPSEEEYDERYYRY